MIASGLTCFFAYHIPKLSFRTSIYDLLIEDLPDTAVYETLKAEFGSDEMIRLVVKTDNVFAPAAFRKVEDISARCAGLKGVRRIISLPLIKKDIDPSAKMSLAQFETMVAPVALFQKNLISADHKNTGITLILEKDADHESVISAVDAIIESEADHLSLYQIGMPLISRALVNYTVHDFKRLPVLTFGLIAAVLFILLRRPARVFLPLMCVCVVLVWTFGLMGLMQLKLSLLTMIVPVFIIAVGTAYSLHTISEYSACARRTDSRPDAVTASYTHTALPCALAVVTTLFGLGALFVNRIPAIDEFALFACFGMISLLCVLLTVLPAVLVLIPLPDASSRKAERIAAAMDRFLDFIVRLNLHHQKAALSIIGLAALTAAAGIFFIRIETNPVEYFREDTPVSRNFHDIYQSLSGSFPVYVTVTSTETDYFENSRHLAEIKRLQDFLETLPKVDKTISFADYLMLVNYTLNHYESKYYALPAEDFEIRMAINNYKTILGEDLYSRFMTPALNSANILMLTHLSSSGEFLKTREMIQSFAGRHFPKHLNLEVTGFGMAVSASSQLLTTGQVKSLSISLVLIFSIMFLMFLSAKVGLIAILPNCFPILMNFGIMGWLGIKLSMATSLIASIAIGLAVDDTIHYLHRYNLEFKKDLDKDRALRDTIKQVGKPIVMTSLTIGIGFLVLMLSQFKPTAIFGFLMVITMATALIGDLVILPSLMLRVELVTAWDLMKLMPVLGGMSAGIAHELNQPLNAIKMGSEFLTMMISQKANIKPAQLSQIASEISDQVDRASEIINRLSAFGQRPDFKKELIDINEPVREVMAMMHHQLVVDNITAELNLADNLPSVQGHKNRVAQIVYNLVTNACDAIDARKKIPEDAGRHVIRICTSCEDDRVSLTVSDTGIGISRHNLGRILEPFFTTKAVGQAKGLGLSICNEIIRDFGGRLEVSSEPMQGAVFKVILPRADVSRRRPV
ncbi:MAG: MMPL family transporter [Desulfobacterales bacterium]|nr:MAG: MMPL family transporter [Desulfobacterales bacterium]